MKNKKLCSLFLAIILMFNMTAVVPFEVFAETVSKIYEYDGYSVDYSVLNEWEGNQSIQVTIRNTGTESILNWVLAYRAGGEVNGLWNAVSPKENIIKNTGYNYEIEPNSSVSFGYTLSGENLELPEKFEIISKRENVTESYDVQFDVYDDWGEGFQGAVTVTNTGSEPIEAWTLSFDTNFTIGDYWGGRIIESSENRYTIGSEMWTNPIMPNSSSSFGFTATKQADTEPAATNFVLTSVKIDENTMTEEAAITAEATYDSENNVVTVVWQSTVPTGIFEVMTSLDGVNFEVAATVENAVFYEYAIDSGFGVLYVKIRQNIDGNVVESNVVTVTENAEDIDYELDTDEDGLPDYYEDILGTDKNNADTDGDGLSDGYEVLYLGTDPLKADTNDNGINDGDEDFDNDGLTNAQECGLGTDPNTADTDGDGLNDGAEVNTHGTDPLKYDTDSDEISDGDEITLGLNPNSAATDGTPDSERTFTQTVSSDSEVLSAVNDDNETPFKVSLEMKSAGVAENNVYARESGYSNAIENSAIIGMAPEFVYTDGLSVEEVTVKFELENSVINNTLGIYTDESDEFKGIKRLNVFMFFEDVNMLLPIETFHDEATNTVYTKTDRVGTYCLVDMEIFLDNLDNQLNDYDEHEVGIEAQSEDNETVSENKLDNDTFSMYNNINRIVLANSNVQSYSNSSYGAIDVAFLIDCRSVSNPPEYAKIKRNIIETADTVFIKSPGSRIKIIVMNSVTDSYLNNPAKILKRSDIKANNPYDDYFLNIDEVYSALACLEKIPSVQNYNCSISYAINYACSCYNESYPRNLYIFCITQNSGLYYNSANKLKENLTNARLKNITVQINTAYNKNPESQYGYARDMVYITNGGTYYSYNGLSDFMLKQIYNNDYKVENGYMAITAVGYKTIVLNREFKDIYKQHEIDASYDVSFDTDLDGLADYEEIMFDYRDKDGLFYNLIGWGGNGAELPTFGWLIEKFGEDLFYVENGLERYCKATGEAIDSIDSLKNVKILPIKSDPTRIDSDGDGITDGPKLIGDVKYTDDEKPLRFSYKYYDEELYLIHLKYPEAKIVFNEYDCTLMDFSEAEYESGWNLTYEEQYKAEDSEQYRLFQKHQLQYGTMFFPNQEGLQHYCDPRTYLDYTHIFAFLDLRINNTEKLVDDAKELLRGSYFDQGDKINDYAEYFAEASRESGLNLAFIISKCFLETKSKKQGYCSDLCRGNVATSGESIGQTVYNMYGIGAYDTDEGPLKSGIRRASNEGWTTEHLAIVEGAKYICDVFLDNSQYTPYAQKYDIVTYAKSRNIGYQYATAMNYAYVGVNDMTQLLFMTELREFVFVIPIYSEVWNK